MSSSSTMSSMCKPTEYKGNEKFEGCKDMCAVKHKGDPASESLCRESCVQSCLEGCLDIKKHYVSVGDYQVGEGKFVDCRVERCNYNPQDAVFNGEQTLEDKIELADRVNPIVRR